MTKRITTVRLHDGQAGLVDKLADRDGVPQAEVIRAAVSSYIIARAEQDPLFANTVRTAAQQSLEATYVELRATLGANCLDHLAISMPSQTTEPTEGTAT
jgi:Ribbon-helix-helix protein, copG family